MPLTLRAQQRAEAYLAAADAPESAIARLEAGSQGDAGADAGRWVRRLLDEQEPDGSWQHELLPTAEALLVLHELAELADIREVDPGIPTALDWLRRRRGEPGRYAEGCEPRRHQLGLCEHFFGGTYSPGTPGASAAEVRLANGAPVIGDANVRLAASCVALRAMLRWDPGGTDAWLHIQGILRLLAHWERGSLEEIGDAAIIASVQALVEAPDDDGARDAAARALELLGGRQRGDGSWLAADAFQALELFLTARARDLAPEAVQRTLEYGARLLVSTQQADGSWGRERGSRGTLIGLRTLRAASS